MLVVTQYFPPEIGAPQARLSSLARSWTADGVDVTVLTGMPNHPTGVIPPQYSRKVVCRERVDGYRVLRTWLYATPNEGFLRKTASHLSFMVSSLLFGCFLVGRQDVIVVSSPTFFSIFSAWILARTRRTRFVIEIRDLWPAIFVELGVLKNSWIISMLEWAELRAYRAADAVVVVSEGFRENLVARGVPADKVTTIRNGVDLDEFATIDAAPSAEMRGRLGAQPDSTLVLYVGAHGISHGLRSVVDAAQRMPSNIQLSFVGDGAEKKALVQYARGLGVGNVAFLDSVPHDRVPKLLAAADICLVPLRDVPLFTTFIPSKIFEYLGASKAVVGAVRGEPATILREAGAVVVEPEHPEQLADAIRTLAGDPDQRSEMGKAGRRYVEEHFDRRVLAQRYLEVLSGVLRKAGRAGS